MTTPLTLSAEQLARLEAARERQRESQARIRQIAERSFAAFVRVHVPAVKGLR